MVINPEKARFLTTIVLKSIVIRKQGFNRTYKNIVRKYRLSEREAEQYYRILYNITMYYHTLRFLAGYFGFKSGIQGVIEYLYRKGFVWHLIEEDIENTANNFSKLMKISILYSYPLWLVKDLSSKIPLDDLELMLKALNTKKRWLRANLFKYTLEDVIACLENSGLSVKRHSVFHSVFQLKDPFKKIGKNPCVLKGIIIPQDISSYVVGSIAQSLALGDFLDACSAPGLKLTQIASSSRVRRVVAVDLSERRVRIIPKISSLVMLSTDPVVLVIQGDSRKINYNIKFDFILLDAPCSNSGAIYDDPAFKVYLNRSLIKRAHTIQYSLLSNLLKQGKLVLYATCSIHPLEGEEVIKKTLVEHNVDLIKIDYPYLESGYEEYIFSRSVHRIYPHRIQGQGFFVALLKPR